MLRVVVAHLASNGAALREPEAALSAASRARQPTGGTGTRYHVRAASARRQRHGHGLRGPVIEISHPLPVRRVPRPEAHPSGSPHCAHAMQTPTLKRRACRKRGAEEEQEGHVHSYVAAVVHKGCDLGVASGIEFFEMPIGGVARRWKNKHAVRRGGREQAEEKPGSMGGSASLHLFTKGPSRITESWLYSYTFLLFYYRIRVTPMLPGQRPVRRRPGCWLTAPPTTYHKVWPIYAHADERSQSLSVRCVARRSKPLSRPPSSLRAPAFARHMRPRSAHCAVLSPSLRCSHWATTHGTRAWLGARAAQARAL